MHPYDWGWNRRYSRGGWSPYDRTYRSGDAAAGGPPRSFYSPDPGPRGYGGYDSRDGYGYGGYAGYRGPRRGGPAWGGGYDRGYRYSYPGSRAGGRGSYGRQEPWEPGPPSGYGSQWERAYGNASSRGRNRGGPWGYAGRPKPYREYEDAPGTELSGGWAAYSEEWEFPPGYLDEGIEDFFDDEEEEFDPFDFDDNYDVPWAAEPDDQEVRERVIRSFQSDGFLNADAIQVEVSDGVVTLRGEVGDYMEARYAWDDAWDAVGVRGVISKLTVPGVERQESPPGAARKAKSSTSRKSATSTGSSGGGKKKK